MSKYNPIIEDKMYWKYQGLLEGFRELIKSNPDVIVNDEMFVHSLAHIAKKVYEMGYSDAMKAYEPSAPLDRDKLIKVKKVVN